MGEEHLGEMNIGWVDKMSTYPSPPGSGAMTLMKSIINDYWADAPKRGEWPREHVDVVMSKLYWCWVRWLDDTHPEADDNE
jgi:hypothetical protein